MKNQQAMLLCDFYKISHREQYPEGTEVVYSTWTPRASMVEGVNKVVSFGQQAFIKEYLIGYFNENFFSKEKAKIVSDYKRVLKHTLGVANPDTSHIEELHDLGYLPLSIKSLPEGTLVPLRVPMFTIENTHPKFYWLTNYVETLASCEIWQTATSATLALEYKKVLENAAHLTGGDLTFVQFQGHDFSMRGMGSLNSAVKSGMGHLLSFSGTDTVPSILAMEEFYNANVEKELVGTSIPATEHSVMCANGMDERSTLHRLLTKVYPTGMLSVVSDTWDFWNLVGTILPEMKDLIMKRDGKLVIRPDTGDPVKIVIGDSDATDKWAQKGLVESLWDIFGGTTNARGYKVLDSHIGAIYGDAITRKRALEIVTGLAEKGFCSTNIVFGIGSFTYQYNTRDTFGFALKSTAVTINGDERMIYKAPKTGDGTKNSAKGRVAVLLNGSDYVLVDGLSSTNPIQNNQLREIFRDGKLLVDEDLATIRARLNL